MKIRETAIALQRYGGYTAEAEGAIQIFYSGRWSYWRSQQYCYYSGHKKEVTTEAQRKTGGHRGLQIIKIVGADPCVCPETCMSPLYKERANAQVRPYRTP